jgi:hypothetical protein
LLSYFDKSELVGGEDYFGKTGTKE